MFSFVQWNLKGYLNNYNNLLLLIKKYSSKVISLQETHLHPHHKNIPIPINYHLYTRNTSKTRYGGVGLLIHKSVEHKQISTSDDFDNLCFELKVNMKFNIISTYISPQQTLNNSQLERVLNSSRTPTIITGDFNGWHSYWGSPTNNSRGNLLAKFMDRSQYIILNDGSPTHLSTFQSLTHIDLTLCSPIIATSSKWHIENNLYNSDHFPIITTLFSNSEVPYRYYRPKYNISRADWQKYGKNCVKVSNERNIYGDTNRETANICKIIHQAANNSIPVTSQGRLKKSVPWWNDSLQQLKLQKNKAWYIFRRNMSKENLLKYKRANAKLKFEIKIAKNKSMLNFTSTINPSSPIGKIWGSIKSLTGYKSSQNICSLATDESNISFTTKGDEIANILGKFWSAKSFDENFSPEFRSCKNKIIYNSPTYLPCSSAATIETDICFIELLSTLSKLKGKSPGLDRINYPMINQLPYLLKKRILLLYNNIFNSYIPQQFKNSLIVPICKPGNEKTLSKSYRPISLNSCLGKVLDKIIANRLWWFVLKNKLLDSHQYGFQKGKSTTDALLYVDHQIADSISRKEHLTLLSLDFEKAYDRIGIHSIVDQLTTWKLGPKIIKYIINFMSNRKITVKNGNYYSSTLPLNNGIPQGSPLSVILFLIAYNKLCSIISSHKNFDFTAYADDVNIIIKSNRSKNPTLNVSTLFAQIKKWGHYSGASLSPTKCKYIHFCRKRNCAPIVYLNDYTLEETNNLKILGLYFNNKYYWHTHIKNLTNTLSKNLNIIKCLSSQKFNCNVITLISITKSIILSKINYCLPFFGQAPKYLISKIKTTTNAAIRSSLGAFRSTPINNMLFEANVPTIENQIELATSKLFKCLLKNRNSVLGNIIEQLVNNKNPPKNPSTLYRVIKKCKELELDFNILSADISCRQPYWSYSRKYINFDLAQFSKNNTHPSQFQTLFRNIREHYKEHKFIFTDGSKSDHLVGYSVVDESNELKTSVLPSYSSIFSAELIAIDEAINIVKNIAGKFAICSDSLSALKAIANVNNENHYTVRIRDSLVNIPADIVLIWIPGHSAILGNDLADKIAKLSLRRPLITTRNLNWKDFSKFLKTKYNNNTELLSSTSEWYISMNREKTTIFDFPDSTIFNRKDITRITRLRLGHTKLSHGHLLRLQIYNICNCTDAHPNILKHFLFSCPKFSNIRSQLFPNSNPIEYLSITSLEHFEKVILFLKRTNVYNLL